MSSKRVYLWWLGMSFGSYLKRTDSDRRKRAFYFHCCLCPGRQGPCLPDFVPDSSIHAFSSSVHAYIMAITPPSYRSGWRMLCRALEHVRDRFSFALYKPY